MRTWLRCLALVTCATLVSTCTQQPTVEQVSEFGRYEGYSTPAFVEWMRTSQHVVMRDGVKLAVDITRPSVNGVAVDAASPVVWTLSRYPRPRVDADPALKRLVQHGYVVVAAEVRGSGASFGRYEGPFSPTETRDAYDVMDWMVKQSWCDGNIGMFGGSYLGITQYMAASTRHPALKAIFPQVSLFDLYDAVYSGGIYREDMIQHWGNLTRGLDASGSSVDDDVDGRLIAEAIAERRHNWDVVEQLPALRFRDSERAAFSYRRHSPSNRLVEMNGSGVAAYHWGGWYDAFAKDQMLWFENWTGPDRVTMGPWPHVAVGFAMAEESARLLSAEQHRWFDRWVKRIENGVTSEPPVRFAIIDDFDAWIWTSARRWPPEDVVTSPYFLAPGPSGSSGSVNDGRLTSAIPRTAGRDRYQVDFTTTTGNATRWDSAVGQGPMRYPDFAANDVKALTYTTAPLETDVVVIGHPIVTLHVSSTRPDADVYALLLEVDRAGASRYVSEGMLRASHRLAAPAPWSNLNLPWHGSHMADRQPLEPREIAELVFDLQPTATLFNRGHRIRVTVMGADADNTERSPATGRSTFDIHSGPDHPSRIDLPVKRR